MGKNIGVEKGGTKGTVLFGNACDKMLSMEVKGLLRWKCRREKDGRFEDHKIVF